MNAGTVVVVLGDGYGDVWIEAVAANRKVAETLVALALQHYNAGEVRFTYHEHEVRNA